ncbi:MAG: hypothetical protein ABI625_12165 [bacterium]
MRPEMLVMVTDAVHLHLHGGAPLDGLTATLTAFAAHAKSDGVPPRRLIIDLKQALNELPALNSLEALARSDTLAWLIHEAIDAYYGERIDPVMDVSWLGRTPTILDGQDSGPETNPDDNARARLAVVTTSAEFVAFRDHFQTYIRDDTQQSPLQDAAGGLARLARQSDWTPADLIKALHTTDCYPGTPFQSIVASASHRYGRGLDMLLTEFFSDEVQAPQQLR